MPPIGVLIKPASSKCNLKCRYCFYHTIAENRKIKDYGFMTNGTIETIIKKVLEFASEIATFSFQGGEPTLCGLDFFKKVIMFQKKHNVHSVAVSNCMQTNGILINEEWAEFLRDNNFLVGLSLDGPSDLNDMFRVDHNGKGTFEKILHTVDLFNRYQVDDNILFVVTDVIAANAERVYDFFQRYGFNYLQFIPCIDPEGQERGSHDYSLHPKDYADFLKQFFYRWYKDFLSGKEISIRYFDNLVRIFMGLRPETCSMQGQCGCQFVFEADGSVYPCDFYVVDKWRLGSIQDSGLMDLYDSTCCTEFIKTSLKEAPECKSCEWKNLCRGGCRRDRENSLMHELNCNYYCEAFKDFFQNAYPMLNDLAIYVQKRNVYTY